MNIEEAVYLLKYLTKSLKQDEKNQIYKEAIETLLTAYEKEKEKNKELKWKPKSIWWRLWMCTRSCRKKKWW